MRDQCDMSTIMSKLISEVFSIRLCNSVYLRIRIPFLTMLCSFPTALDVHVLFLTRLYRLIPLCNGSIYVAFI